jgi:YbbR domain-containing protein
VSALAQHWELRILAVVFAFALWLFVVTSEKSELIISAPVEVDGLRAGVTVVGEQPESVDVQLHGLRGTLARLDPEQLRARLNVAGARTGEVIVRVLPENISVPPGVTVLRVNPSRVRLVLTESGSSRGEQPSRGPRS